MNNQGEMELTEHLEELRTRILRALGYVLIGAAVIWVLYRRLIYPALILPISGPLEAAGGKLGATTGTEWFFAKCTISIVVGIILSAPAWLYEVWAFVAPGLTGEERRRVRPLVPASAVLFILGAGIGYLVMGKVWFWFLSFAPEGSMTLQSIGRYLSFVGWFLLAFGLAFQFPLLILFLVRVGVISSASLSRRWKETTVVLLIASALATPGGDPISTIALAVPLIFLYLVSLKIARLIEPKGEEDELEMVSDHADSSVPED